MARWTIRAVTLVMALLAFAALDDLTTNDAETFAVEYAFLAVCAAWFVFLGLRCIGQRRVERS